MDRLGDFPAAISALNTSMALCTCRVSSICAWLIPSTAPSPDGYYKLSMLHGLMNRFDPTCEIAHQKALTLAVRCLLCYHRQFLIQAYIPLTDWKARCILFAKEDMRASKRDRVDATTKQSYARKRWFHRNRAARCLPRPIRKLALRRLPRVCAFGHQLTRMEISFVLHLMVLFMQ